MTEMEFANRKIDGLKRDLARAETLYHHATLHGSVPERDAALADCQRIRAKLIQAIHVRDQMTGGATDGE